MIINSLLGETRSRKARVAFCKLQSALIFHKAHNDANVLASQLPKLFQYRPFALMAANLKFFCMYLN